MMRNLFGSLFLFLILTLLVLPAQARPVSGNFEFSVGMDRFETDGDVQISDQGTSGSRVDITSDLDLGEDEAISAELRYRFLDNWSVGLRYSDFSFQGTNTLNQQITYAGQQFTANTQVTSDFDIGFWDLDLAYTMVNFGNQSGGFLDLLIGARAVDFSGTVRDRSTGTSASESFTGGVPVIGLHLRKSLIGNLFVEAKGAGLDVSVDEYDFKIVDLSGHLGYTALENWQLKVGYRDYSVDGTREEDSGDDKVDLSFSGANASVTFLF